MNAPYPAPCAAPPHTPEQTHAALGRLLDLPFLSAEPSSDGGLTVRLGTDPEGSHAVRTLASCCIWLAPDYHPVGIRPGKARDADALEALCGQAPTARGSVVVGAFAMFVPAQTTRAALQLQFSDGTSLGIFPDLVPATAPECDDEIVDWEIVTPEGTVRVGPGGKHERESAAAPRTTS